MSFQTFGTLQLQYISLTLMFSYLWTKVALFFFSWPIFDVPASYKIFIVVTLACFVLCVMSFILVGCFSSLVLQGRDCLQLTMKKSLVSSFWSEKEDGPYTVMILFSALLREPYIEIVLSPCHWSGHDLVRGSCQEVESDPGCFDHIVPWWGIQNHKTSS